MEPESWKNVGASLVHAIRILKDHQVETVQALAPIKQFIDQFSDMMLQYKKQN